MSLSRDVRTPSGQWSTCRKCMSFLYRFLSSFHISATRVNRSRRVANSSFGFASLDLDAIVYFFGGFLPLPLQAIAFSCLVRGIIFHIAAMSTNATLYAQHALQGEREFPLPSAILTASLVRRFSPVRQSCLYAPTLDEACIPLQ